MVIFDRIGRDSDCSFINSSSEKKPAQIGEAPLAKLTEIHSPRLVQEKSFENQNAFLQRKGPAPRGIVTLTCIFIIVIHGLKNIQKKNIWDIGLWMSSMTQSHGHAMKWKKDFFHCHPAPASLWRTVPWSWRWCKDSGQEAALDYPNPSSSSEIEKVVSCGCLHRRRAWNSPTAPQKSPNSALLNKKHLHGIGDAFLMHCDDKKAIRHFSGLFFGL